MPHHRQALLVAVSLAVAAAVPATATAPAPSPAAPAYPSAALLAADFRAAHPDAVTVSRATDGTVVHEGDLLQSLLAGRRHSDTAGWLSSTAAATKAVSLPGAPAPLVVAPAQTERTSTSAEPPAVSTTSARPYPAGDLDGDGLTDVLVARSVTTGDGARTAGLDARSGGSGAVLWTVPVAADGTMVSPLRQDVTGDGIDDLLVEGLTIHAQELEDEVGEQGDFAYAYSARFTDTLSVVSGRTGTTSWTRSYPGTIDETESITRGPAGATEEYRYRLRSSGLAVLAVSAGDLTGDGLGDVVVDEIDLAVDQSSDRTEALAVAVAEGDATIRSTTTAQVLRGTDGSEVHRLTSSTPRAIALLRPVGDVDARPGSDLLWTTATYRDGASTCYEAAGEEVCTQKQVGEPGVVVELLHGGTRSSVWQATLPGHLPRAYPVGDLDGDDRAEVVVDVASETTRRLTVLSGTTGRALWSHESENITYILGAVPSAGGPVVTLASFFYDERDTTPVAPLGLQSESVWSLRLERRAGTSGALIGGEVRPVPVAEPPAGDDPLVDYSYQFTFAALGTNGDTDGDGRRESYFATASQAGTFASDGVRSTERSTIRLQDLLDGRTTYDAETADVSTTGPYADLDGDGLTDLVNQRLTRLDDGDEDSEPVYRLDVTTIRPFDRARLWTLSGGLGVLPRLAGDLDGLQGDELLATGGATGEAPPEQVRALRGSDLSLLWRT